MSTCSYKPWPLRKPTTATPLLMQSAGCSVPAQELGICLPGVCTFGLLPQSAPSGSRFLLTSIYSHELQITPEQGPSWHLWLSRWALHQCPHGWALTMPLHAYMEGAARFMSPSPSRAVRLSSHLLRSASAHLGILTYTLPGIPMPRHRPWKHTQPRQILLRYPGAEKLHLPRQSPLDSVRHWHFPPMGRAHYRPDGTRRRTSGELAGRAKKKAQREAQAQAAAAAAAPSGEAEQDAGANEVHLEEPACDEEELVEIEVEVAEEEEASPVRQRPRVHLRPAPKWGAARSASPHGEPRARRHVSRSRSRHRTELSAGRLFALSKALTRLLRHKAEEEGLPLRPDGLFCLDAVVRTREMRQQRATSAELLQVTYQDEKQRFTIRRLDGVQYIRAAQGHSQYVSKEHLMQRVRRKDLPPYLYHGTRAWNYESIARRGLLAGGPSGRRTDIHLVEHLPNSGRKGGPIASWRSK